MLSRLYVKNVALISEADILFDGGLNVLSGETGSGKSVILDSVNFVLGCKADRTMIRYGEYEAFVKAEFSVEDNSEAVAKLGEYDIECDGAIIISRKLNADGKGSIKINGNAVTVSMLRNITQHLVDVHGQSEHFFLLNEENQLKVIDGLLGESARELKAKLSKLISEKKEYKAKISVLGGDEAERARKLDLLGFQINEIESAELKVGEFEDLKSRQNIVINSERILSTINCVKNILDGEGGCGDGLSSAVHELNRISGLGDEYAQISARLEGLGAEVADLSESLSDIADGLTFDEKEAQHIDERLTLIKTLKKKYGADEKEILAYKDKTQFEFDLISDNAAMIDKYTKKIEECDNKIFDICTELTILRKQSAQIFCDGVVKELQTLNIPDAKFGVKFNEYNRESANLQSSNGCDEISFEFSANKGEPLKTLNKVISGGEMSRFMLAVKTKLKNVNGISTYIFDEIDAGISGYTAGTVARKFMEISQSTQILAVSHLPQVCAASDSQFLIYKIEEGGKTYTKIRKLDNKEKIDEIVRLTGSVNSDVARLHAEELIKQFKK